MKRFLMLAFCLISPIFAFSQYNFFKGYIVTNAGDTSVGYVYGRESVTNPKRVRFKESLQAETRQLEIEDCKAFGIYKKENFERHFVKISQSTLDLSNLPLGVDTASTNESVFLKVLQSGKNVTIYQYADDLKSRFYIKDKDMDVPMELVKQVYLNPDAPSNIIENNRYRSTLGAFFNKYKVSESKMILLKDLLYDESGMINMGYLINDEQKKKSTDPVSSLYVSAGANILDTKYRGYSDFADPSTTSKIAVSPYLGVGFDVYTNPAYGKTLLRAELGFFYNENEFVRNIGSVYKSIKHSFKQYNFILSAHLIHNVYNTSAFKAYLGAGFSIRHVQSKNNIIEREYSYDSRQVEGPKLEKMVFGFPVKAGMMFYKRVEFAAAYQFPSPITNYSEFGIWSRIYSLSVNYHFGKLF
ncbi:hypothetical protein [Pedobacter sp.]